MDFFTLMNIMNQMERMWRMKAKGHKMDEPKSQR